METAWDIETLDWLQAMADCMTEDLTDPLRVFNASLIAASMDAPLAAGGTPSIRFGTNAAEQYLLAGRVGEKVVQRPCERRTARLETGDSDGDDPSSSTDASEEEYRDDLLKAVRIYLNNIQWPEQYDSAYARIEDDYDAGKLTEEEREAKLDVLCQELERHNEPIARRMVNAMLREQADTQ